MGRKKEVLTLPSIWNVSYRRNPFFTGREDVLKTLHTTLTEGKTATLTQPQAISGLGGIGKTQVAIEYAYRYGNEYRAVLWVKADSREALVSDFVSIADPLDLPEKNEQDQNRVVNAVKRWLQNYVDWLLILDNVEELEIIDEFVPPAVKGHILLTTRAQATGTVNSIGILEMETEEGALFLLRRSKVIKPDAMLEDASESDRAQAREISETVDGLPLALDQAAAYIEETRCGLTRYLELYWARRADLLKRRGTFAKDHPESVTTTFSLSFEKVEKANPAAADLLRLCAFLHPDDIPEEIFTEDPSDLGLVRQPIAIDPLILDEAIGELLKYSLVRRDFDAKMLSVHRLVQAVMKDGMDEATQRVWAERTVQILAYTLPDVEQFSTWQRWQRYLIHALVCTILIRLWKVFSIEASHLVNQVGYYIQQAYARYKEAESLYTLGLTIDLQIFGSEHPVLATDFNNLAEVYRALGKYAEAESLYQLALNICIQNFGNNHPKAANSLNNLGVLYDELAKYDQAESFLRRALAIRKQTLKPDHIDIANSLNNLAEVYREQGKYDQAEPLYLESLTILKKTLGTTHPDVATTLNNMAELYNMQKMYDRAEQLHLESLAIAEQTLESKHPDIAGSFNNLAGLYVDEGRYDEAEPLLQKALLTYRQILGEEHPSVARTLHNLGWLYYTQGKHNQAETLYLQAKAIYEQNPVIEYPDMALNLYHLAMLYFSLGKYDQAKPLHLQLQSILERILGPEHPDLAQNLHNTAMVYFALGRYDQAEPLFQQALKIFENAVGPEHLHTATVLQNHARLLRKTNREVKAAELEAKAKIIRIKHTQKNLEQ